MLAQDEVVHTRIIKRIYDKVTGGGDWGEELTALQEERRSEDLSTFITELAQKHGKDIHASTGDLEALDVGLNFERKAVDFYTRHLETATEELEKKFLEEMVAEERSHVQLLLDMQTYLKDPSGWFEAHERPLLNGA